MAERRAEASAVWPEIPFPGWRDTCATLHLWTQIVGKVRLAHAPWVNHSWGVALYLTSRGLTTSPIPYGQRTFQIDFDFIDHRLLLQDSDGQSRTVMLAPRSVADFYREVMVRLKEMDLAVTIHPVPCELPDPLPLDRDEEHAAYDAEAVHRFWRALVQADRVLKEFRSRFLGKCSPVHFFWGSFDLAVTRFSGRRAPEHPGGVPHLPNWVVREAYSHEVSSCGFWPGNEQVPEPAFYAYAYPQPRGFADAPVRPEEAFYHPQLGEFVLPYEAVRRSDTPDRTLLDFLQSTYEAACNLGGWDRKELERASDRA